MMSSKLFFLAVLLTSVSMSFAGDFVKEDFTIELNEKNYGPLNENENFSTPLIQLNSQGYFGKNKGKNKGKKAKKKSVTTEDKKDPFYANKHRPPAAPSTEPNREGVTDKEKNPQASKTEIVVTEQPSEQVWDQDGRELSRQEIEKLP